MGKVVSGITVWNLDGLLPQSVYLRFVAGNKPRSYFFLPHLMADEVTGNP